MENVCCSRLSRLCIGICTFVHTCIGAQFQYKALVYNNICKFKSTQSYKRDAIFDTFFLLTEHPTIYMEIVYFVHNMTHCLSLLFGVHTIKAFNSTYFQIIHEIFTCFTLGRK